MGDEGYVTLSLQGCNAEIKMLFSMHIIDMYTITNDNVG